MLKYAGYAGHIPPNMSTISTTDGTEVQFDIQTSVASKGMKAIKGRCANCVTNTEVISNIRNETELY